MKASPASSFRARYHSRAPPATTSALPPRACRDLASCCQSSSRRLVLAVVNPTRSRQVARGRPGPEDVLLLIEVMDNSADLGADTLEMYRRPTTAGYSDAR